MYYRVPHRLKTIPSDHHFYGYETYDDFLSAISRLHKTWRDKEGRQIAERHGFIQLRIYSQYRTYQDVWFPKFMLEMAVGPKEEQDSSFGADDELDRIFGFD